MQYVMAYFKFTAHIILGSLVGCMLTAVKVQVSNIIQYFQG